MFHLQFKHTWHLKWNRSESMHQTFSKGSLNLCKQKLLLFFFFVALYLWNSSAQKSLKSTLRMLPRMPQGMQPHHTSSHPRNTCSHPAEGSVLFPYFTTVVIPHASWKQKEKHTIGTSCDKLSLPWIRGASSRCVSTALFSRRAHSSLRPTVALPPPASGCWKESNLDFL